ncbi:MAG: hypothetical protein ACI32O_09695 [Enterococcus sp.]
MHAKHLLSRTLRNAIGLPTAILLYQKIKNRTDYHHTLGHTKRA